MHLIKFWSAEQLHPGAEESIELFSHDPLENPYNFADFCAAAQIDCSGIVTTFVPEIFVQQLTYKFGRVFDTVRVVPSKNANSLNCMIGEWDYVWFIWAEPEEWRVGGKTLKLDRYFAWVWSTTA